MSDKKTKEMAKILHKIDALQFGLFKLTNGKVSPYYVDLKIIPSFPDIFSDMCNFYVEKINQFDKIKFDRIAGVPLAGIPFASQIAYNLKKPFLYVRKERKPHGTERRVEGILVSGDRVLIVDDLVTTGLTLKNATQAVREEGGVVTDAVTFIDREEGATKNLEKIGVKLRSILKISQVANILYELGSLEEEDYKTVIKQVKKIKVYS